MLAALNPAEVEDRLSRLIARHKAKNITVAEIKRRIFETGSEDVMAESRRFHKWWIGCFRTTDEESFTELLSAFQDAWNSFPHSSLSGKSPQQMVEEEMKKHPDMKKNIDEKDMPTVIVGGIARSWDDHWNMIKKMEKLQKPFKKWIDETALPSYKNFLEHKFKSKKSIDKHYDTADIFLKRVLHVGFLTYEQIRPAFAVWEFPEWWQTHVLYSDLTEDQVWSSLCDFLWFVEIILKKSIPGVWEEASGEKHEYEETCPMCREERSFVPKPGRNEPCPCGSGKKFKKCCME